MTTTGAPIDTTIDQLDEQDTTVSGQQILPALRRELGTAAVKLSTRVEEFCWHYVRNFGHGTKAYLAANPGVKEDSARARAAKLLAMDSVKARIKEIRADRNQRHELLQDQVIEFHARALEADHRKFFDEAGRLIPVHQLPDELAQLVSLKPVVSKEYGVVMLPEIQERGRSADALAKIFGMNKDRHELTGANGGPMQIAALLAEVNSSADLVSK